MEDGLQRVLAYHQATKHQLGAYARGPGYLDWSTQPDPFRRYRGSDLVLLPRIAPTTEPTFSVALTEGQLAPAPLNAQSVGQLFYDSLALSVWKELVGQRWSLRVNPSSGNLHPTEGYLITGGVSGLGRKPLVAHYAPREHALEIRAEIPAEVWRDLEGVLPADCLLLGFSSIHWREAWKYGERAFRYCQHDIGHAMAAVSVAAAGLGWQTRLWDDPSSDELSTLLGLRAWPQAEPEEPDCLLVVAPTCPILVRAKPSPATLAAWDGSAWLGEPNLLSADHVDWPLMAEVAAATWKPATRESSPGQAAPAEADSAAMDRSTSLRHVVRRRRSAVALDGRTAMPGAEFYHILAQVVPGPGRIPFQTLPWSPKVHLLLFVHRVTGLESGLYCLLREPGQKDELQRLMMSDFLWQKPEDCPDDLALYRLDRGDVRRMAGQLACGQDIAADGCFSLAMLADFSRTLRRRGAWFYRRLFWECGLIGQRLYLEAEAAGLRGCGIGCYFDDELHELLGLDTDDYQSLYHFTVGGPVEDSRLSDRPAYS